MKTTKLKREIMNEVANFEISVSLPNNYAMSKKDFKAYKQKYNYNLEKTTRKILTLFWNAVGELM